MKKAANQNRPPFRCAVNADLFRRAMAAVSHEETRYYLQGVFVQPCPTGGAMMTSTNGHWLINIHDPRGICEGDGIVTLNRHLVGQLVERRSDWQGPHGLSSERVVIASHDGDTKTAKAMIVLSGVVHTPKGAVLPIEPRPDALAKLKTPDASVLMAQFADVIIDGAYPDWQRIVPTDVSFAFNAPPIDQTYVMAAAKALSVETKRVPIRLGGTDASSPVVVLSTAAGRKGWDGFAVVMPIRDDGGQVLPGYWQAQKAKAA